MRRRKVVRRQSRRINPIPKILIAVIFLFVIVAGALYYNFVAVGQAIKVEPKVMPYEAAIPSEEANLDQVGAVHFVVGKVNLTAEVTLSSVADSEKLFVGATKLGSGLVEYVVERVDVSGEKSGEVARGLLNGDVASSGDLFLDDDDVADVEVVFINGVLKVYNLNYLPPEASIVDVYAEEIKEGVHPLQGTLFFVQKGKKDFYVKVSASSMPAVTGSWKGGEKMELVDATPSEVMQEELKFKYRVMKLGFDPAEEKPYVLLLNVTGELATVQKELVFAVSGKMYDAVEKNYPRVQIMKQSDTMVDVNITFEPSSGLYGFSLPCGIITDVAVLSGLKENVEKVYTDEAGKVVQWRKDAPVNDFTSFAAGKGYLLKLQKDKRFSLYVKGCHAVLGEIEQELPELKVGWNLVGIKGNRARAISELKVASGRKVVELYSVSLEGNVKVQTGVLEPGRAYWIKVE